MYASVPVLTKRVKLQEKGVDEEEQSESNRLKLRPTVPSRRLLDEPLCLIEPDCRCVTPRPPPTLPCTFAAAPPVPVDVCRIEFLRVCVQRHFCSALYAYCYSRRNVQCLST